MTTEIFRMSFDQFCTFFDFNPKELVSIEVDPQASSITVKLLNESETAMSQTSGAFPQLNKGGKRIGTKKGGRKTC